MIPHVGRLLPGRGLVLALLLVKLVLLGCIVATANAHPGRAQAGSAQAGSAPAAGARAASERAASRPETGASGVTTLVQAEAVRAGWDSTTPPADGWVTVQLPDDWARRWPGHDGVVWYRLRWDHHGQAPSGLLVPYVCMASAIRLNGSLLHQDPHLVEPLSRAWTRPWYFTLDAPVLRQGTNELLLRVSGLAAYQPGIGPVQVGAAAPLQASHRRQLLLRHDAQLLSRSVGAVLGILFGMLWLLGRRRTMYGWFALSALFSAAYGWNFIADSPWPLPDTDRWQAMIIAVYVCGGVCMAKFLLRYCQTRWPRLEAGLLAVGAASLLLAALAPGYLGPQRAPWALGGAAIYYAAMIAFILHALRRGETDQRLLAACFIAQLLVSVHDLALFFGLVQGDTYLLSLTSPLTLLGVGFVLAFRYARSLQRVEGFNQELRGEVRAATRELTSTLQREHALALDNTRYAERLNLVRDLHDGFGGTLVGAIARLERPGPRQSTGDVAALLREMRDDLRLVIDSTAQGGSAGVDGVLAAQRFRWSQRLEAAGIAAHWSLQDLDTLPLPGNGRLDLLRWLQEALSNVLKHSRAHHVWITLARRPDGIEVEVRDDGCGLPDLAASDGFGQASMAARAHRLGGRHLAERLAEGGTRLQLWVPFTGHVAAHISGPGDADAAERPVQE